MARPEEGQEKAGGSSGFIGSDAGERNSGHGQRGAGRWALRQSSLQCAMKRCHPVASPRRPRPGTGFNVRWGRRMARSRRMNAWRTVAGSAACPAAWHNGPPRRREALPAAPGGLRVSRGRPHARLKPAEASAAWCRALSTAACARLCMAREARRFAERRQRRRHASWARGASAGAELPGRWQAPESGCAQEEQPIAVHKARRRAATRAIVATTIAGGPRHGRPPSVSTAAAASSGLAPVLPKRVRRVAHHAPDRWRLALCLRAAKRCAPTMAVGSQRIQWPSSASIRPRRGPGVAAPTTAPLRRHAWRAPLGSP